MCSQPRGETWASRSDGGASPASASRATISPELPSVPVDDDGGKEVQAGDPVVLRLGRPIADLTASVEADGTLERMMGLTFVQPQLRPA